MRKKKLLKNIIYIYIHTYNNSLSKLKTAQPGFPYIYLRHFFFSSQLSKITFYPKLAKLTDQKHKYFNPLSSQQKKLLKHIPLTLSHIKHTPLPCPTPALSKP